MVIAKKVLFLVGGIIKVAFGGFVFLVSGVMFLLKGFFQNAFEDDFSALSDMVEALAADDPKYAYLLEATEAEVIDFVMSSINAFSLFALIFSAIWIAISVYSFVITKKLSSFDTQKKGSIVITVISWLVSPLAISTILYTVATCLKKGKKVSTNIEIEAYQE